MSIGKFSIQKMKNIKIVLLTAFFLFDFNAIGQMKQYTLEECVLLALEKNISIKFSTSN